MNLNSIIFAKNQVGMFFAGFCLTMGSGLAAAGGDAMTFSQLAEIPVVVWVGAIGAGITSAMGVKKDGD